MSSTASYLDDDDVRGMLMLVEPSAATLDECPIRA